MTSQPPPRVITKNTGVALGVVGLLIGYTVYDTKWRASVDNQLRGISAQVQAGTADRWTRKHMLLFRSETLRLNPDIVLPDLQEIYRQVDND